MLCGMWKHADPGAELDFRTRLHKGKDISDLVVEESVTGVS